MKSVFVSVFFLSISIDPFMCYKAGGVYNGECFIRDKTGQLFHIDTIEAIEKIRKR